MPASMPMPETAMHVDDFSQPRQNDIRRAGKITPMQAEAKAETVNQPPDNQFGLGVAGFDRGHDAGTFDRS